MSLQLKRGVLRGIEAFPPLARRLLASTDYELLPVEAGADETEAGPGWKDPNTARRQDRAWSRLTDQAIEGHPREDIRAVVSALDANASPGARVLEVGCGSGYFSRIILHARDDIEYVGLDYSRQMVQLARERNPGIEFVEGDATDLDFPDDSFDVVLDGAALIHMPNWRQALAEYHRVSRGPVVLSSLTLTETGPTRLLRKRAYGSPVSEFIFARPELEDALSNIGLLVKARRSTLDYDLSHHVGIPTTSELWVCE